MAIIIPHHMMTLLVLVIVVFQEHGAWVFLKMVSPLMDIVPDLMVIPFALYKMQTYKI